MSFSPNGVYFEELSDSPKVKIGQEMVSATRVFLCNWSDWQAMCYELIGVWRIIGLAPLFIPPISFPGVPLMVVSDIDIEPFDGHSPQSQTVDLGMFTNTYQIAKLTVQYKTMSYESDRNNLPPVPEGTILNYSATHGAEVITLPNRTLYWATTEGFASEFTPLTNYPVGDDTKPGIIVPTGELTLSWKRVLQPPWDAIKSCRGKINASTFIDNDPGTALFLGSKETRTYQFGQLQGQGQLWDLEYTFSIKSNKLRDGTTVVGWNYFLYDNASPNTQQWVPVCDINGNAPYESTDFDQLFQFGTITVT